MSPVQSLQRHIKRSFPHAPRGLMMLAFLAFVLGLLFGPRILALLTA
jgi:hypothetical protein